VLAERGICNLEYDEWYIK